MWVTYLSMAHTLFVFFANFGKLNFWNSTNFTRIWAPFTARGVAPLAEVVVVIVAAMVTIKADTAGGSAVVSVLGLTGKA